MAIAFGAVGPASKMCCKENSLGRETFAGEHVSIAMLPKL